MEELIPLLIAAIIFGFQAFANFQKEQKKARERRFSKPAETYDQDYEEEYVPEEYIPYELPDSPYGQYQGVLEAPSTHHHTRLQDNKQQQTNSSGKSNPVIHHLRITDLDEEQNKNSQHNAQQIDLRQAVIHSMILERPYQ